MWVSLRSYSGTIISTFLMKLLCTFRGTCIYANVNYISVRLCEFTHQLNFLKKLSQHTDNGNLGKKKKAHMDFQAVFKCPSPITFTESNISQNRWTDTCCEVSCYRQKANVGNNLSVKNSIEKLPGLYILRLVHSTDK